MGFFFNSPQLVQRQINKIFMASGPNLQLVKSLHHNFVEVNSVSCFVVCCLSCCSLFFEDFKGCLAPLCIYKFEVCPHTSSSSPRVAQMRTLAHTLHFTNTVAHPLNIHSSLCFYRFFSFFFLSQVLNRGKKKGDKR